MDLEKYKAKLLQEQKEIAEQIGKLAGVPDMGSDVESSTFDEEADEAEEYSKNLGLKEVLKARLVEIKHALDKISDGKAFGACENCEKEIEGELLDANPECRHCKEHHK